jgi:hypothetical protein
MRCADVRNPYYVAAFCSASTASFCGPERMGTLCHCLIHRLGRKHAAYEPTDPAFRPTVDAETNKAA